MRILVSAFVTLSLLVAVAYVAPVAALDPGEFLGPAGQEPVQLNHEVRSYSQAASSGGASSQTQEWIPLWGLQPQGIKS